MMDDMALVAIPKGVVNIHDPETRKRLEVIMELIPQGYDAISKVHDPIRVHEMGTTIAQTIAKYIDENKEGMKSPDVLMTLLQAMAKLTSVMVLEMMHQCSTRPVVIEAGFTDAKDVKSIDQTVFQSICQMIYNFYLTQLVDTGWEEVEAHAIAQDVEEFFKEVMGGTKEE